MKVKNIALTIAGAVFLIIAIIQLLRFLLNIPVTVSGIAIPVSLSLFAFGVMLILAIWMFFAGRE
jgi:hypothetical protein